MFSKSWKTTTAGVLAIVGGITGLIFNINDGHVTQEVITTAVTAVLLGVGLLFAKDSNITGGTTPQTHEAEKRTGTSMNGQ